MPPYDQGNREMSYSKINDKGNFRSAQGTEDLQGISGAKICIPPDTDGLSDFQSGDEVDLTIKGRVGEPDEDGNIEIEPINIALKPMPGEAKMFRRDEKNSMPPPETLRKDDMGDM